MNTSILNVLIGYMFLFIHRPFEVWPMLASVRLERVYMIFAITMVAFHPGKRWPANRLQWAIIGFALAVVACWLASPWSDVASCEKSVEDYLKILVFYFLMVLVVHDERGLRRLLLGFLGSMGIYMVHSLYEFRNGRHVFRMGIARMIGVDQMMSDPNTFGATVAYALPIALLVLACRPSTRLRLMLYAYLALSVLCILLTGSRTGLLILVLTLVVISARSRYRWRMSLVVVVVAPLVYFALPPSLQNRFLTIVNPSVGPANARVSTEQRSEGFYIGLELWNKYPLTGVGPGAWRPATGREIESHNLYGQVTGEMGYLGVLTFAFVLCGYWTNLRWLHGTCRENAHWGDDLLNEFPGAIGLTVVQLLAAGLSSHNLFRYTWLWYAGFLVVACDCAKQRVRQEELSDGVP